MLINLPSVVTLVSEHVHRQLTRTRFNPGSFCTCSLPSQHHPSLQRPLHACMLPVSPTSPQIRGGRVQVWVIPVQTLWVDGRRAGKGSGGKRQAVRGKKRREKRHNSNYTSFSKRKECFQSFIRIFIHRIENSL